MTFSFQCSCLENILYPLIFPRYFVQVNYCVLISALACCHSSLLDYLPCLQHFIWVVRNFTSITIATDPGINGDKSSFYLQMPWYKELSFRCLWTTWIKYKIYIFPFKQGILVTWPLDFKFLVFLFATSLAWGKTFFSAAPRTWR